MIQSVNLDEAAFDTAIRALLPEGWSSAWGEESLDWIRARGYANTAIRAYLSALSPPPVTTPAESGGAWHRIASVPKDGQHVLVRFGGELAPPTVAHWFDGPEGPGLFLSVQQNAGPAINPTHWRHIPEDYQDGVHRLALAEIEAALGSGLPQVERLAILIEAFEDFKFPALAPSPVVSDVLSAQPAVQDGWVLVPREPTEAMLDAHYDAHATADTVFADARDVWSAMLAAAPSPASIEETKPEPVAFDGNALWEVLFNATHGGALECVTDAEMTAAAEAISALFASPSSVPEVTDAQVARNAVIEECAAEIDRLLEGLHHQHEVLDIGREDSAYTIAAKAVRSLRAAAAVGEK